ncbi:hypothetical protein ACFV3E_41975 [Streptomyces sp. NPDC059718]
MNAHLTLAAAAAEWGRLSQLLAPDAQRLLGERLAELRAAGTCAEPPANHAARTLLDALPVDEAARLGQRVEAGRFTNTLPATVHGGFAAADLCMLVLDGNPMVGPVLGPIRERLLSEPALTETYDADPRLITLSGKDGRKQIPLFQFEAGTMPWPIVLEINSLLRADTDPWGTADWWLAPTTWWDGTPASVLGRDRDQELLGAARSLLVQEEDS